MAADFNIRIAVTPPEPLAGEPRRITALLDSGRFTHVHLRHPGASLAEMMRLLTDIPPLLHGRLRLHGHFDLVNEFNLGGLHLNSRCPAPPAGYKGRLSRSCHSVAEAIGLSGREFDYATLSPVFDSISKPGHRAAFSPDELRQLDNAATPIIALGGVTPARIELLRHYNFAGYAMLSAAWDPQLNKNI